MKLFTLSAPRHPRTLLRGLLLPALAALCVSSWAAEPDQPYADPLSYSPIATASLPASAPEAAAVVKRSITLGKKTIAYTATTGHLNALDSATGQPKASMFYVAYTRDGAVAAKRPITFFYNGGPGSATIWLHMGSFAPKRVAVPVPATGDGSMFPVVDNAESLIDVSDLVFIDAVGTGFSQAIAPHQNSTFWGVDADAEVFRDFIRRYIEVNQRSESPKYLYGESYGGIRSGVLARLLEEAKISLKGVILNSPILNYNSNCERSGLISCAGYLPSYAATGAFFQKVTPAPTSISDWLNESRTYTKDSYGPAVAALLKDNTKPPATMPAELQRRTGLAEKTWRSVFNVQPDMIIDGYLPGELLGRYDARIHAPKDSPLAVDGDPSYTLIEGSFVQAMDIHLLRELRYTAKSSYVAMGNAIGFWKFAHAGKKMPDVVPDFEQALKLNPKLRIFTLHGANDVATPFYQTEMDIARIRVPYLRARTYMGGHMTYIDDTARRLMKADLRAFYAGKLKVEQPPLPWPTEAAPMLSRQAIENPFPVQRSDAILSPLRDPWGPGDVPAPQR